MAHLWDAAMTSPVVTFLDPLGAMNVAASFGLLVRTLLTFTLCVRFFTYVSDVGTCTTMSGLNVRWLARIHQDIQFGCWKLVAFV
jgi:hypothetical protein